MFFTRLLRWRTTHIHSFSAGIGGQGRKTAGRCTVTVTTTRTDTAGKARIAVAAGHEYLLDAVVLRPAPEGAKAVWETLWAALTFAVP